MFGMSKADLAMSKLRSDVYTYFKYCPLCFLTGSMRLEFPSTVFGKIHLICGECGARWHINYGKTVFDLRFKWAKLVSVNVRGSGSELLQKEHKPEFWQHMALEGRKSVEPKKQAPQETVKEREIIKEVIVKIRCPYCYKLYEETQDKCPHCGASR